MFIGLLLYPAIAFLLAVYVLNRRLRTDRRGGLLRKIPGGDDDPFPLMGVVVEFFSHTPVSFFYRNRRLCNVYQKTERIRVYWMLGMPNVILCDLNDIEVLLSSTKHIKKGFLYVFAQNWLKEGLLTSTGEKWKTRRKILTPTFHFNILKQFSKTFIEQSNELIKHIKTEINETSTSLLPLMANFTLIALSETAMGLKLEGDREHVIKYRNAIFELGETLINRVGKPWLNPPFIYPFTNLGKKEAETLSTLHGFTTDVIRTRRVMKCREESDNQEDNSEEKPNELLGAKKRMAMLDLLLKAESNGQINESGIREEVDTFMFEGHDTTTHSLTYTLMLLANNPDVQDRVFAELDSIFLDADRSPTYDDLSAMNYLEMCIKESLRLYPSVPYIGRELTEDLHLKTYTIPAGTSCDIHIYDIHRDPSIYQDPDRFDPDRFLPENTRKRHPYAFLGFSAGPRNCIGQRFALQEEKIALATILKHFRVEPVTKPEDIIFVADIVLRSRDPIKVKFVERKSHHIKLNSSLTISK